MAHSGFFCTQYLLNSQCDREKSCIFLHVNIYEVNLDEPIPNGSEFVKGHFVDNTGFPLQVKHRVTDARTRHCFSRYPCYFITKGQKCPYEKSCMHPHSNIYWKTAAASYNVEMDRNPIPSTSNINKNSASTSNNTIESEDESCLGATALIRTPSFILPQKNTSNDSRIITENKRNLVELNINAPEFIPRPRFNLTRNSEKRLCPFAERDGLCKYPPGECTYLHGDMCDLCARPALHPYNEDKRKKHTQDCIKRHERDMEIAFAIARSKEKICGICFEVIMQKTSDEQRFGILPSCNHCFCLACIRRWRQSKQFDNKIIRSCPECRIPSDFVCPSAYWVDTKEDKEKVIEKYKLALSKKDCKYFKNGRGHCPFGNKCFYRHCLHNGKRIDVGPPPSTNTVNSSVQVPPDVIQEIIMLEQQLAEGCPLDFPDDMDIDEILHMLDYYINSDSDDSYYSE